MKTYDKIFTEGYDRGYNSAVYCEIGEGEELVDAAVEAESKSRSFSPFEHLASELNARGDSEEAWDHFEQGVSSGISVGVADRRRDEEDERD